MTAVLIETEPVTTSSDDDDLHHIRCCIKDRALCGADLTGGIVSERPLPGEERCTVCFEWEDSGFPCSVGCDYA